MIAGWHADITLPTGRIILELVQVIPGLQFSLPLHVEIAVGMSAIPTIDIKEQGRIIVLAVMAEEIQVKTRLQRLGRIKPFRDQDALRIHLVKPRDEILFPKLDRGGFIEVVLDEAGGHVHPETVHALVHPESHDILEFPAHGHRSGRIHGLFPRMSRVRMGEAEIQGRLGIEEILDIIRSARSIRRHELPDQGRVAVHQGGIILRGSRLDGRLLRLEGRPDVIVGIPQVRRLLRLEEPLVLVG